MSESAERFVELVTQPGAGAVAARLVRLLNDAIDLRAAQIVQAHERRVHPNEGITDHDVSARPSTGERGRSLVDSYADALRDVRRSGEFRVVRVYEPRGGEDIGAVVVKLVNRAMETSTRAIAVFNGYPVYADPHEPISDFWKRLDARFGRTGD